MHMFLKVFAHTALLFLLFAVSVVTVFLEAKRIPRHVCHFDELEKSNKLVYTSALKHSPAALKPMSLLSNANGANSLAKNSSQTWAAVAADEQAQQKTWKPLRIAFSSQDMRDQTKYCDKVKSKRRDALGKSVVCKAEDALTDRKRKHIYQILRAAIAMHTSRLRVSRVDGAFRVPTLDGAFCKMFTVPNGHKTVGISNADMMLYVASFPSNKAEMFAAAAPCVLLQSDNRPVVGALTFTAKYIAPTVYSVRVAMHEIAHTLGFTYKMMKDVYNMQISERQNVRHKEKVTELQTATAIEKFKEHYGCNDGRGMELEDESGVLNATSQSHWERRNALEDLMAGIVVTGAYTALTLAAFHDMKVYKADFDKAEKVEYGLRVGCDFFKELCIVEMGNKYKWMLCVSDFYYHKLFCAPGRRAMARCSPIVHVGHYPPMKRRYFHVKDGYGAGETRLLTDRCPVYEEHDDLSCTNENSKADGVKSPQSWCLRKDAGWHDGKYNNEGFCGKFALNDDNVTLNVEAGHDYDNRDCRRENNVTFISFREHSHSQFGCPTAEEVQTSNELYKLYMKQSAKDEMGNRAEVPTQTPTTSFALSFARAANAQQKKNDEKSKDGAAHLKICAALLAATAVILLL